MNSILQSINSPQELKGMDMASINMLAEEIRQLLVNSVSQCGDIWQLTWRGRINSGTSLRL